MSKNLRSSIKGALNSSIKPGLLAPAQFRGSTLDLDFAGAKSLKNQIGREDIVSFARASSATYVGADGLIKTTPVNLIIYSEQFDDSAWTKSSGATVNLNAVAAPDGTNTGSIVNFSSSSSRFFQTRTLTAGTYTLSVFLRVSSGSKALTMQVFNSTDGSQNKNITVTDSWQRFTHTVTVSGAASQLHPVRPDDLGDVYVWGAQLEEGSTATEYIPTTSTISGAPRFDHDPATGESLGLLIEESRTNSFTLSEFETGYSLGSSTSGGLLSDTTFDGLFQNTGVAFGYDGSTTSYLYKSGVPSQTSATISLFVRMDDGLAPSFGSSDTQSVLNDFALVLSGDPFPPSSYKVEDYGSGLYRVSYTDTSGTNLNNSGVVKYSGNSNRTFKVSGYQVELNSSFPTSYIPTSGSTVTRAADVAEITGANFSKTNLLEYSERFEQSYWNKLNSPTLTPNSVEAPDGSQTAETFDGAINNWGLFGTVTVTPSTTYTTSFYVKQGTSARLKLRLRDQTNLVNIVERDYTSEVNTSSWTRVTETFTTPAGCTSLRVYPFADNGVGTAYLWGVQVEEGSVLTDYTPSVESFVSRASSATYVDDATGFIKTTPVNSLTYSEDFTQSGWSKQNGAVTATTSDTTSPTGVSATFTPDTTNDYHGVNWDGSSLNVGTLSIYAKPAGYDLIQLRVSNINVNSAVVNFDLTNGLTNATVGLSGTTANGSAWTINDYGIESVRNGWYRIHMSYSTDGTNGRPAVRVIDDFNATDVANVTKFAADGTSGVMLTGAQFETDSTTAPTDYIKTTGTISGAARYENGELLLEEARTNLVTYSGNLSSWTIQTGASFTANQAVAPDGSLTASLITGTGNINDGAFSPSGSVSGSSDNTKSIYLRTVSGTASVQLKDPYVTAGITVCNLTTEWQRFSLTETQAAGLAGLWIDKIPAEGIYAWGAQLEEGSYPTSYIPTTTSSVTRAADVSTSAVGVDSFYNQSEGTVFTDTIPLAGINANTNGFSVFFNSDNNNFISVTNDPRSGGWGGAAVYNNNINQFTNNNLGVNGIKRRSIALAYQANNFAATAEGQTVATDGSGTVPVIDQVRIGAYLPTTPDFFCNGHIKRLAYFPTRLPDATLQNITS